MLGKKELMPLHCFPLVCNVCVAAVVRLLFLFVSLVSYVLQLFDCSSSVTIFLPVFTSCDFKDKPLVSEVSSTYVKKLSC